MDLIDREQAISKLEDLIIARRAWLSDGSAEIRGIDAAICELAALPSAEKTGKWLYYSDNGRMRCKCSNCLTSYGCLDTPYCPNCGFKMEG